MKNSNSYDLWSARIWYNKEHPALAFRVSPVANRLQKNMYGDGYQEFADYSAVDAVPNPGYRNLAGLPFEGQAHGVQNSNIDLIMQRMADMMQNQYGLKPKN